MTMKIHVTLHLKPLFPVKASLIASIGAYLFSGLQKSGGGGGGGGGGGVLGKVA